jgi:hypothetical protein
MNWAYLVPILITAIVVFGIVFDNWIKARHGYPITDDHGNVLTPQERNQAARQVELLSTENEKLRGQVSRLEERIAVLERIATDPAERTAREIEKLR